MNLNFNLQKKFLEKLIFLNPILINIEKKLCKQFLLKNNNSNK